MRSTARWPADARRASRVADRTAALASDPAVPCGRRCDSLVVLAGIDRHGKVVAVRIPRKSRHEALNRAARDIVLAGQPYDPFTLEMAAQSDVLQLVRTWAFTNGSLHTAVVQ